MIDPPRLKVAARHPMYTVLLESALEDHSAPGAAGRALRGLGLGTSLVATAVAVKASASAGVGGQWVGLVAVKWLGLGLFVGATALLSTQYAVQAISGQSHGANASVVDAPRQVRPMLRPAPATPKADPIVFASPALTASEPSVDVPARPPYMPEPRRQNPAALATPIAEPAEALLDELKAIRAELAAHAPVRALALIDAFDRRHPDSSLAEEIAVLRIHALMSLSRSSEARALAEDFLNRYPRSAYAERVRARVRLP